MSLIAIDPGVNAIGVAYWSHEKDPRPDRAFVVQIGPRHRSADWNVRVEKLLSDERLLDILKAEPDWLVVEWPEVRGGAVGNAAAKRGNVSQLAFCCGMLACAAIDCATSLRLVPVSEWKGQLPKEVTEKRIIRAIGDRSYRGELFKSHAFDAVGIGLHCLGWSMTDKLFLGRGRVVDARRRVPKKSAMNAQHYVDARGEVIK